MKSRSNWSRWLTIGLWLSVGAVAATLWLIGTGLLQLGSDSKSVFEDVASTLPSPMPDEETAADVDPSDDVELSGEAFDDTFGGLAMESAAPEAPPRAHHADMSEGEIRPGQALPAPRARSTRPRLGSPAPSIESPPVTIGSAAAGSAAPTGTPKPPPPPTVAAAPAEPVDLLAEVDRQLAALELGNIAFNTPDAIPLGDAATIELLLSLEETANELSRAIRGSGPVETARVQISDQVEARLTGLGFRVEAVTPERQAVSRSERTRWQWQIEPTKPDRLALHLTLSAVIKINGIPSTRSIRTFEKTIYVEVPFGRRVADMITGNLEVLSSLVLIPIVGGVWRHYRRRKRRLAQTANADTSRRAA